MGPLGVSLSVGSIVPIQSGAVITLSDNSRWNLCLLNGMSQDYSWWNVGDSVFVAAGTQSYVLINKIGKAQLAALFIGQ